MMSSPSEWEQAHAATRLAAAMERIATALERLADAYLDRLAAQKVVELGGLAGVVRSAHGVPWGEMPPGPVDETGRPLPGPR